MRLYVCHAAPAWFRPRDGAEAVKIGVSTNPFRRKWGLRRDGGESPSLVWQSTEIPRRDAYAIEAALKRRLADRCVGGTEWFSVKPATAIRVCKDEIKRHAAHKILREKRRDGEREWFNCTVAEARAAIERAIAEKDAKR